MKRIILLLICVAVLVCSLPAFAAGNNIVLSSDMDSAVFVLTKQQLDKNYTDSNVKYYTFSVSGLSVRVDKNNFYDHGIKSVEVSIESRSFMVKFTYNDSSTKNIQQLIIPARYTVTGNDVFANSVAAFGNTMTVAQSVQNGSLVFESENVGAFTVKKYEFTDVKDPSMWYYKYVTECASLGVISGMGDGSFMPQGTLTRAQLAVMIVRSTENIISYRIDPKLQFNDVKKGSWYYDAVMKCATMGIVFGKTDSLYAPDDSATREQIAAVVARVINIAGVYNGAELPDVTNVSELSKLYPDSASISNYARSSVLLCNKLKIMVGDAYGFRPASNTTRAECAVIFHSVKKSFI